ncbi:MAG TPA: LytTR family DNA-binding domain-containing protein [Bacteroidia bacterium]|nr:LytTR family DNA-binding domain-containing protein [Bacteroidia bacterium]
MYTALIVDDEKDQRDVLSSMLRDNFPGYQILDRCGSVDETITKIGTLKPQLVFLDVLLPPLTGFDVLTRLKQVNFEVIFATSYEKYALHALKVSAVDFLLKPFSLEDLKQALEKFEKRILQKSSQNHIDLLLQNIKNSTSEKMRIALPTFTGFVFAQVSDIVRCQSDDMYTTFYFYDKSKLMVSRTLKECEELLGEWGFFRTHASHLINMRFIKEYLRGEGGQVTMTDGSTVDVSRRKKDDFVKALNKL